MRIDRCLDTAQDAHVVDWAGLARALDAGLTAGSEWRSPGLRIPEGEFTLHVDERATSYSGAGNVQMVLRTLGRVVCRDASKLRFSIVPRHGLHDALDLVRFWRPRVPGLEETHSLSTNRRSDFEALFAETSAGYRSRPAAGADIVAALSALPSTGVELVAPMEWTTEELEAFPDDAVELRAWRIAPATEEHTMQLVALLRSLLGHLVSTRAMHAL